MSRNRRMMRSLKQDLARLPDGGKEELYAIMEGHGMGVEGLGRILSDFCLGVRPKVKGDDEMIADQEKDPNMKPKVVEHKGEKRIRIDARTQFQAIKLVCEIYGLKETGGVNVSVNSGTQVGAVAGARLRDLGHVILNSNNAAPDSNLSKAIEAMPIEQRRILAAALKDDMKEVVDTSAVVEPEGDE